MGVNRMFEYPRDRGSPTNSDNAWLVHLKTLHRAEGQWREERRRHGGTTPAGPRPFGATAAGPRFTAPQSASTTSLQSSGSFSHLSPRQRFAASSLGGRLTPLHLSLATFDKSGLSLSSYGHSESPSVVPFARPFGTTHASQASLGSFAIVDPANYNTYSDFSRGPPDVRGLSTKDRLEAMRQYRQYKERTTEVKFTPGSLSSLSTSRPATTAATGRGPRRPPSPQHVPIVTASDFSVLNAPRGIYPARKPAGSVPSSQRMMW
eukprot:jgi/Chrpa1/22437/Chrysochromulina_OHIO_Genome00008436-RA